MVTNYKSSIINNICSNVERANDVRAYVCAEMFVHIYGANCQKTMNAPVFKNTFHYRNKHIKYE
jgi:hypothetical protein